MAGLYWWQKVGSEQGPSGPAGFEGGYFDVSRQIRLPPYDPGRSAARTARRYVP